MNETLKRAISGSVYVILLLFCIYYSAFTYFILFCFFLIVAIFEFSSLLKINKILPIGLAFLTFFGYSYTLLANLTISKTYETIFLLITLYVSIRAIFFLFNDLKTELTIFNKVDFLIGYIIFPFLILAKIPFGDNNQYDPKIITGIFIIIWTNDTFAYIVGKSIGKNKLLERISPKKTIEGFIGGVAFAIIAGLLISKYFVQPTENFTNKSALIWMTTALLIGVFGTIGDLIESKFKRIAGVKDSGKIMPGHGGILDRLDSVIFVAPFIYLFYQILYYVS
ncbi:MAG: phosphatidate cytidylyltransferase [Flavobacterium sp.]|nr:phosphatidate cytidylyltransferase [Flavobacterium sp.]